MPLFGEQNSRPASQDEIAQLFDMTTARPQRSYFIATIRSDKQAWSQNEIDTELKEQNKVMRQRDAGLTQSEFLKLQIVRSNSIVKTGSGQKTIHVQEWYSGHYYRSDQTDSSNVSTNFQARPNVFHDTIVNIHDPSFSDYSSYSVNHELKDALLTKDTKIYYHANDLWRVISLDKDICTPITLALVDFHSINPNQAHTPYADFELNTLKADILKIERLHNNSDPAWHLEAANDNVDGIPVTRFTLEGQYPVPEAPTPRSSIQIMYWIGKVNGKTNCIQAMKTNFTLHTSFFSKRGRFDDSGFPHLWTRSTFKNGVTMELVVDFEKIDPNPDFADVEIFSTKFPTNYTVSDVTSGFGVLLQTSHPEAKIERVLSSSNKRFYVIIILAIIALSPIFIALKIKNQASI